MQQTRKAYLASQPRKRMGAGVLVFDANKRLLVVKPTYKTGWIIPGGTVERDESPRQACLREAREEIGIDLTSLKMVALDYVSANDGESENLQFIFSCRPLSKIAERRIKLQAEELEAFKFAAIPVALGLLRKKMARRLPHCLKAARSNGCAYWEDGSPLGL